MLLRLAPFVQLTEPLTIGPISSQDLARNSGRQAPGNPAPSAAHNELLGPVTAQLFQLTLGHFAQEEPQQERARTGRW